MKKRLLLTLFSIVLLLPHTVQANTTTLTTGIESGSLELTNIPSSFTIPNIQLNATNGSFSSAKSTSGFTFNITDSRGTGEGYRLDISASPLTEVEPVGGFAPGTSAKVMGIGSVIIRDISKIESVGDTTSTPPTRPMYVFRFLDFEPYTLLFANVGEGMGSYDVTFPSDFLSVRFNPASKPVDKINYPGVPTPYETTISWTLSNTP